MEKNGIKQNTRDLICLVLMIMKLVCVFVLFLSSASGSHEAVKKCHSVKTCMLSNNDSYKCDVLFQHFDIMIMMSYYFSSLK